ncbi:MAG: acyltransferase [Bacteroidetes bacterium GWA2_30_7]|nr:MAG: acyltransferase [Bacteroidetes bacterium GWA2_30_7]
MAFNSTAFLIFLFIVYFLYWKIFKTNLKLQNLLLLISSYFFYGWWDWRFLSLIFISTFIDYTLGLLINSSKKISDRKIFLTIGIVSNLGLLGFFKYFNFFIDSLNTLLSTLSLPINTNTLSIILPVGISFYTFQSLSYTIDIYRNKIKPTKDIISFFSFVSFFPQLVAGPIERAENLLPQFFIKRNFDYSNSVNGLRLILWGLFKKIAIADILAITVESVYNNPSEFDRLSLIIATIYFAIQIYCDFSGYSDIAIGTAKLFGFELMTNFKTPYFSSSIKEFWQRWHISLSTWFKDYLYITLGGNRVSKKRNFFNIIITFTVSGFWHGANFTFIIWGFIHGFGYFIESKFTKLKFLFPKYINHIITILIVLIAWIFFRAKSLADSFSILNRIFISDNNNKYSINECTINKFSTYAEFFSGIVAILVLFIIDYKSRKTNASIFFETFSKPTRYVIYYVLIVWIFIFGQFQNAPQFIYFQF